jgi:thioredoxin 1
MAGDNVFEVGDSDFKKQVLESDQPVLVDFWATWCAPCRAIAPSVDALASQFKGKVKFAKVNVDDNQDTAQEYGVRSIPTLLVFKGGKVVGQLVGAAGKDVIEKTITKAL